MTKAQVRKFIGKRVELAWRDPTDNTQWTSKPLAAETARATTFGILQGFNVRGELVIASSIDSEDQCGNLLATPLACVEQIRELDFKLKRHRARSPA